MNVLIGCECSGRVRDAFAARGHNAWSCDVKPTEAPGNHIQDDVLNWLGPNRFNNFEGWNFFGGHPTCTRLCNSGVLRLYVGGKKAGGLDPLKWEEMLQGAKFFKALLNAPIDKVYIENPVPHGYALKEIGGGYSQTIQPYEFGEPESKRTCLWLKNLPLLKPTNILTRPASGYWDNQCTTGSGQSKLGSGSAVERSRTYKGIAEAMANQWG